MKKIDSHPFYGFLKKEHAYLTSLGFFIILLTLTLFIDKTGISEVDNFILLLQGSALLLVIISFTVLIIRLREHKDPLLQVTSFLLFFVLVGFLGVLWHQYRGVVNGFFVLAMIMAGLFHIINSYARLSHKRKRKNIVKQNKKWIVPFIFVIGGELILIITGNWVDQFEKLIIVPRSFVELIANIIPAIFVGYLCFIIMLIFGGVLKLFDYLLKKL